VQLWVEFDRLAQSCLVYKRNNRGVLRDGRCLGAEVWGPDELQLIAGGHVQLSFARVFLTADTPSSKVLAIQAF
jgi:hypothetical protein